MKFRMLFLSAVTACLLLASASGTAMARNDCLGGSIAGGKFSEIVINEFVSCKVVGVYVTGNVRVRDAENFTMISSLVEGNILVTNTKFASLIGNKVETGNIVARGNLESAVWRNAVIGGSIRVNDESCGQQQVVTVLQNLISTGNLRVNCNEKADVKENKVTDGDITCRNNDRLDSKDNDAFGGTVNGSLSLF